MNNIAINQTKETYMISLEEFAWEVYEDPKSTEQEVQRAKRTLQRLGALPSNHPKPRTGYSTCLTIEFI